MCVVSMITEHYTDKWRDRLPNTEPWPSPLSPYQQPYPVQPGQMAPTIPFNPSIILTPGITSEEILEFRRLLARAREYDARNNEPSCEMKEKQDLLISIAKALGVKITIEELNG